MSENDVVETNDVIGTVESRYKELEADVERAEEALAEAVGKRDDFRSKMMSLLKVASCSKSGQKLKAERVSRVAALYNQGVTVCAEIDLHNLMHVLTLRVDSHAQWEIQQYGRVMAGMFKRVAPLAYEAWVDYEVCGIRLSRMEVNALRTLLRVGVDTQPFITQSRVGQCVTKSALQNNSGGMSDREIEEFFALFPEQPSNVPDFELDLSQAKDGSYFEEEARAAVPSVD